MTSSPPRESRAGLQEELGRWLLDTGAMTPDWAPAFAAVPRDLFLPDVVWPYDMASGGSHALDRRTDPEAWLRAAYADVPLTIQWDDGRHTGTAPGTLPSSSASMPSVVLRMLAELDVYDGARVLEIGTGTGWNAGLLAHRLGGVTTVEIDPGIADLAATALAGAGLNARVASADGRSGWPATAPYDRVIVTAGVRRFPGAWLEQTRPGGLIVAPWGTHYCDEDALVRLTVGADGGASGPFTRPLAFMKLRDQRLDWSRFAPYVTEYPGDATESSVRLSLADLGGEGRFATARFVLGLCVPDCAQVVNTDGDRATVWFFDMTVGSRAWASVSLRAGEREATVRQSGPRALWDEVAQALAWWRARGAPPLERFGLTVAPDGGARAWLGEPARPVPVLGH